VTRRVLVVGPPPHLSGGIATVTRVVTEAAASGACADWEVSALDSGGGRGPAGYRQFPGAVATVLRTDADLLHLNMASGGSALRKTLLAEAARWRGLPYVVHLHGGGFAGYLDRVHPRYLKRLARAFRGAGAVVVLGNHWRDVVADRLELPEGAISVVPNGVPDVGCDLEVRAAALPRTLLFVGEVTRHKGVDVLLTAVAELLPDRPDWQVVLCGPTPDAALLGEVQALSVALGGRVLATGNLGPTQRDEFYRTSHLFCLPSLAEGLPMVLLEAMSAGLPCVATDVGAVSDIVDDTVGALVPAADAAALTQALATLMDDAQTRDHRGGAARARWTDGYSNTVMATRLTQVWDEAAAVVRTRHTGASAQVSVIIPTLGRPSLHEAVASARAQGVPVEVIVIDDSSGTLSAGAVPAGVVLLHTAGRVGAAAARNLGMQAATGEVIAFLDDDDTWRPGHLQDALGVLARRPDVSIYASRGMVHYPHRRSRVEPVELLGGRTVAEYFYGPSVWSSRCRRIMTPTLVFRRQLADHRMDSDLAFGEDTWWLLTAERQGAIVHQSAHVGVDVVAAPERERERAGDSRTRTWLGRIDGLDPELGTGYLVGSVAREQARSGQPGAVIRTAIDVVKRRGGRWVPVLAAQSGAALVVHFDHALKRWRGR